MSKTESLVKIKKHVFTPEEDLLIGKTIRSGGFKNILDACEFCSKEIHTTVGSISARWYYKISKNKNVSYATGSDFGMLINRKVVSCKDGVMRNHVMKPLLYFILEMNKLSQEDQQVIIKLFS